MSDQEQTNIERKEYVRVFKKEYHGVIYDIILQHKLCTEEEFARVIEHEKELAKFPWREPSEWRLERDNNLIAHDPFVTAVITVPAVINPEPGEKLVQEKTKRILEIAADQKHEVLILGAWGCGVYNNDPEEVATLFKGFLENEFRGIFSDVIFAIPGKDSRNYKLFESILA